MHVSCAFMRCPLSGRYGDLTHIQRDLVKHGSTAEVLVSAVRDHDIVARVGGDEFALLGIECDDNRAEAFVWRIQNALKQADIRASVGLALRAPDHDLASAWDQADADMYTIKHAQRDRASNT